MADRSNTYRPERVMFKGGNDNDKDDEHYDARSYNINTFYYVISSWGLRSLITSKLNQTEHLRYRSPAKKKKSSAGLL